MAGRFLLAFACQGALLGIVGLAAAPWLRRRFGLPHSLVPITAGTATAALGYGAFWFYFASPTAGRIFSWFVLGAAALRLARRPRAGEGVREWALPSLLAAAVGAFYVSLAYLFRGEPFFLLARERFLASWPSDNQIPALFADHLWSGTSPKHLLGDWLSSDRPPLQTGWILLLRPVTTALGLDGEAAAAASVWFQLLWVPALWALFRRLGADCRKAAALIAALAFSGLFLFYTVFTWPKLSAAALVLNAFLIWWAGPDRPACPGVAWRRRAVGPCLGGVAAALGWLAHGGVAFSLIALVPLAAWSVLKKTHSWRQWAAAGIAFLAMAAPWRAYQKFYEPPGDRLLKWHLAGVVPPDSRSFAATAAESYRHLGWKGAWDNRLANLQAQTAGVWPRLVPPPSRDFLAAHRIDEVYYSARAFAWWLPFAALLPWALWRDRGVGGGLLAKTAWWWLGGWAVWLALMFQPGQAIVHQGTLLTQLLGFALMAWSAWALHRIVFLAAAIVQAVSFLNTWVAPSSAVAGPANPLALGLALASGAALAAVLLSVAYWPSADPYPNSAAISRAK